MRFSIVAGACLSGLILRGDAVPLASRNGRRRTSLRDLIRPPDHALQECIEEMAGSHVKIIKDGDGAFHRETKGWRGATSGTHQKPMAVVIIKFEDDVPGVLECARLHSLSVSVRSGGHSLENSSLGYAGQLVLDVRNLNHIVINKTAMSARVGPGVSAGALLHRLDQAHMYFPLPTCLSVNLGGFLTGGGAHTLTHRSMGPAINFVSAATVFLANGTKLRLRRNELPTQAPHKSLNDSWTESSDVTATPEAEASNVDSIEESLEDKLWWAIRGGGGSFGIVTEFELNLRNVISEMWETRQYKFRRRDFRPLLKHVQPLIQISKQQQTTKEFQIPLDVHVEISLTSYGTSLNILSSPQKSEQFIRSLEKRIPTWVEAQELVGSPGSAHVSLGNCMSGFDPFAQTKDTAHSSRPTLAPFDGLWHSMYLENPLNDDCIDILEERSRSLDPAQIFTADLTYLQPFETEEYAYPHTRFPAALVLTLSPIKVKGLGLDLHAQDISSFLHFYRQVRESCGAPAVYYNYLDNSLTNATDYFGRHTHRLMKIKSEVDPSNLFSFPNSIPPYIY